MSLATLVLAAAMLVGQETPAPVPEAPFGLTWGMSKRGLSAIGFEPKSQMTTPFGESCVVSQLPKELADQEYAVLSFGYDDQLIRIVAVGGGFEADHDGNRASARYAEIRDLLEKKYGTGKSDRHVDKLFDGDNFALGLQTKKNWIYTEYAPEQMYIQLSLFWDAGKTYWRVIVEHRPGMERLEGQRHNADKDAF